jgi:CheY-like chemotaxis protein
MARIIIPWVGADPAYDIAYIANLNLAGIDVEVIEDAGSAIYRLMTVPYRLILTSLELAPGMDRIDDDVDRIMAGGHNFYRYWRVCEHLIRLVRDSDANIDTPILVADVYSLGIEHGKRGTVDQFCLRAGASEYVDKTEVKPDGLLEIVQKHIQMPRKG